MNIDDLTLGQLKEIKALLSENEKQAQKAHTMKWIISLENIRVII